VELPDVAATGKQMNQINSNTFPIDQRSFHLARLPHSVNLKDGQCARLKYYTLIAKYDNIRFTFDQVFELNDQTKVVFEHEGFTSIEKPVNKTVETIIEDKPKPKQVEIKPW